LYPLSEVKPEFHAILFRGATDTIDINAFRFKQETTVEILRRDLSFKRGTLFEQALRFGDRGFVLVLNPAELVVFLVVD
jgi:hypothetical protein